MGVDFSIKSKPRYLRWFYRFMLAWFVFFLAMLLYFALRALAEMWL